MRRICFTLHHLLLACGLILSVAVVEPSLSARPGPAHAAGADQGGSLAPVAQHASPRAKRKQDRRQARHHDRQQARKRDHAQARHDRQRQQRSKGKERKKDLARLCDNQANASQDGPCTHGPDPAPPGFDVKRDVRPLSAATAAAQTGAIACDGDGQGGFRVQLLYVHASDVPGRYAEYRSSIQAWGAEADQIFQRSAAHTGGDRRIRFVHDQECQPIVAEVQVSPAGDGSFWTMIEELKSQGYNRTDRIYQAFVDANAYCGVGVVWNDDRRDGLLNRHNIGPSFSRIDSGCWGGDIAAHELTHNLGGVQLSAPHSSGGFHCVDEYDVMCYEDGGQNPGLEVDCLNPDDDWLLDCNHDDYFSTSPVSGSYLASHWNAANNRFLIGAALTIASPPAAPLASSAGPSAAGGSKQRKVKRSAKGKKRGAASRHHSHRTKITRSS